jgi:hypothetical protein
MHMVLVHDVAALLGDRPLATSTLGTDRKEANPQEERQQSAARHKHDGWFVLLKAGLGLSNILVLENMWDASVCMCEYGKKKTKRSKDTRRRQKRDC